MHTRWAADAALAWLSPPRAPRLLGCLAIPEI